MLYSSHMSYTSSENIELSRFIKNVVGLPITDGEDGLRRWLNHTYDKEAANRNMAYGNLYTKMPSYCLFVGDDGDVGPKSYWLTWWHSFRQEWINNQN